MFVDLGPDAPSYYIVPEWWIQNDIYRTHEAYLVNVPGQLLVQFKPTTRALTRTLHRELGARVIARIPTLRVDVVQLPGNLSVPTALRRYLTHPSVAWVEPNFRRHPLEVIPNDPMFSDQWGLKNDGQPHGVTGFPGQEVEGATPDADIDASDAWSLTQGSTETVVAVLDTGVDLSHPDLQPSLWSNPDEIAGNGLDDDANGYVDDINGWDFAEGDGFPQDEEGHGTHVAGTIAAATNNGTGVAGVCPGCRIMVLKFGFDLGSELEAIAYAADNGADILNASFGGAGYSRSERAAFALAGEAGILAVAAAGNELGDNDNSMAIDINGDDVLDCCPVYPASYNLPTILSVTATNDLDEYGYATVCAILEEDPYPCAFANWGHDSVDVAAPGVDILSTIPGGYDYFDGTSMAAPHVSGVAGLVKSLHPDYSPVQVKNAIMNSVDRPATLRYLYANGSRPDSGSFTLTDGRVNAARALSASTANATPRSDGNIEGARGIRQFARGSVAWPEDVNDVYKKRLRRGELYGVGLDVPRGKDYDLYVWKPGTEEIWQCWNPGLEGTPCQLVKSSERGRGKDEILSFRARRSGTYYFHVSSWFSSGRYALAVVSMAK